MVLRSLLLVLLLAGCKESLFDERIGDDDAVDAGVDAGDPPDLCPTPCVADAVDEFSSTTQGNPWRYRAGARSRDGFDLVDLGPGSPAGGLSGWVSEGDPAAGIALCGEGAPAACAGLAGYLLVVPSGAAGGLRDPALELTIAQSGKYRLSGAVRLADGGVVGVEQKLLVYRNGRHDVLARQLFTPALSPTLIDIELEAVEGDRLIIELKPMATGTASPLGLRLYLSELTGFPGACNLTLRFDGDSLVDDCAGITWDNVAGSSKIASVDELLGDARKIVPDQYFVATGAEPLDMSGDFTIQWWMRDQPQDGLRWEQVFANTECVSQGGLWLTMYPEAGDNWDMAWSYHNQNLDYCSSFEDYGSVKWTQSVESAAWHFYRIVRTTGDGSMTICVDGEVAAVEPVGSTFDLTSAGPMYVGRDEEGAANASAIFDDFRTFSRALPCTALP